MEKADDIEPINMEKTYKKCENGNCVGGQGFQIRDKMFCSPVCANEYFNLEKGDADYWDTNTRMAEGLSENGIEYDPTDDPTRVLIDLLDQQGYSINYKLKLFTAFLNDDHTHLEQLLINVIQYVEWELNKIERQ